jgi:hypothetical protein
VPPLLDTVRLNIFLKLEIELPNPEFELYTCIEVSINTSYSLYYAVCMNFMTRFGDHILRALERAKCRGKHFDPLDTKQESTEENCIS